MRNIRASIKLSLFLLWSLLGIPFQWLVLRFTKGPGSLVIPLYWHKVTCALFGLKVEVEGQPVRGSQAILASNHLSYLDIPVFSCITPWSFVARADVATWPLFGTFARLQQTAFTSRSRTDAMKDRNTLATMLAEGKNLIIFPEGTSSDGSAVLPFKSSLLSAALDPARVRPLLIQPVTVVLLEADGRPAADSQTRDIYAWHGDMTMPPHLWAFAGSKGARLRLVFHPPFKPDPSMDRKALARLCEDSVREGLRKTLAAHLWHGPTGPDHINIAVKEEHHDLYTTGSQPSSSLSAGQIRQ